METLLKNDFTTHHNLPLSTVTNISATTSVSYFELKDDATLIYTVSNSGIARYSNSLNYTTTVLNYERFINSLPAAFLHGREKCDLIVYTDQHQYFILNELTDTQSQYIVDFTDRSGNPRIGKRTKAISQLLKTLSDLMNVPTIRSFIEVYTNRHCCFFNKQSTSPPALTATVAFNRINTLTSNGFKMPNPAIGALGFELYEYSGNQIYTL
ncbi:MAG TPA: hypothetical protein VIM75_03780 [Ohtaekwangia sp.]|uniref:hypothetical protein n=1 Tax=Ohtaekwangia sp. TaxID=2066019 RepID=UPI002F94EA9F